MARQIIFATNNTHKLDEMRSLLGECYEVLSLADIGCRVDIPEDGTTLEENAVIKARWVAERYNLDCIADDTGLEVDALGGAPGVHSARYAPGPGHDAEANTRLLLHNLEGVKDQDRSARFRTVIALIEHGCDPQLFEGRVEGFITEAPQGAGGFGYDPVFRPADWKITFGQASPEMKNSISHRARASAGLVAYLST
ncbi:MAG: RdgB/HAM1 family non-canonical purine NTP pyrophosphatase [Muribaculaceae bacterium]|nr:RdgB/HAM1 family non-canonical purine NTP pyrophosphatase [Muribaculaceae bacterium]